MGASDRAADLSLDDGPSKKSIFSLLSLPLRSRARNRNLAEFYVQVDDPHRHYSAGEHVTGSVIISSIKPIRITHLTVCLHGYVRVFKNAAQVNASNIWVMAMRSCSKTSRSYAAKDGSMPDDGSSSLTYYSHLKAYPVVLMYGKPPSPVFDR
jgi:hypothetical protein